MPATNRLRHGGHDRMDIRHICRLFSHCCHPLICWSGVVGLIVGLGLLRLPLRLSSRVRVVRSQQTCDDCKPSNHHQPIPKAVILSMLMFSFIINIVIFGKICTCSTSESVQHTATNDKRAALVNFSLHSGAGIKCNSMHLLRMKYANWWACFCIK